MFRSILAATVVVFLVMGVGSVARSQDILIKESDPDVVALSQETDEIAHVFQDTNNDGVYDSLTINGELVQGSVLVGQAEGFRYEDGRYIVLYPADTASWGRKLPTPGTSELLGFIHYFDDGNISTYLAIVAEQAVGDDTTSGLGVFVYDSAGLRVGAPTTMFMEKARLRAIPIYQEWVQQGKDFGIGSNPVNSQFFVFAKDLGLMDEILVVIYQLYQ